ncbi:MAG TPA: protein kinase [Polyangiaceae bacterium]|jgi:tetratricopeptide (TPR) repeat protein
MEPPVFRDHTFTRNRRFLFRGVLGKGSSGVVYRARDEELDADVALKALRSVEEARFSELKTEFRSLAGITHPNLVELHELFVDGPECYFTMELVDGVPFVQAPGSDGDRVARLRTLTRQLALGLTAIHGAGKLHRDVKPSNVLVDRGGRVVILDFGLTASLHDVPADRGLVGTAVYMAPDLHPSSPPSVAADWYSVGVMLFEALIGRPPFEGSHYEVLERKRSSVPPRPRDLDPRVPEDLDALVSRLLSPASSQRPGAAEVLAVLDGGIATRTRVPLGAPFVGRGEELERLAQARARVTAGGLPVVVRVTGPSGIGKSETVRRFVSDLRSDEQSLVLEGRCHPFESVPYKALDAAVDGLVRHLTTLPQHQREAMRPADLGPLVQVFPGLARPFPSRAPVRADVQTGLQQQRRRAFEAFRQLVGRVAERRRVTLWIDDLQWGDVDSLLALREVILADEAPAVLLIVSFRVQETGPGQVLKAAGALFDQLPAERVDTITLEALDSAATLRLARALCDTHGVAPDRIADAVATESSGIPFFIGAIAQRRAESGSSSADGVALSQVVRERMGKLTDRERSLVETIAIAGGPVARDVVVEAAEVGGGGRLDLLRLGNGNLVRPAEWHDQPAIEIYHDRIREFVVAELSPEKKRDTHRRLADSLRRDPSVDPEVLVEHYVQAGDDRQTGDFARVAADRAASALAFERASELYRLALRVRPEPELHGLLAESLANAGRSADAARAFGAAAEELSRTRGDDPRVLEYRRREGEHYLRSGHIDEGSRCLEGVAATVGFVIPRSRGRAMLDAGLRRASLLLRGTQFRSHGPPHPNLDRIDALWGSSTSLSMLDYVIADALGVQHLLEALDAGEPSRIIRGLGYEAAFEAILGGSFFRSRCARIVARMEQMAAETGSSYDLAWARMSKGITAWFHADWDLALASCDEAAVLYRENCRGIAWEVAITDAYALPTLAYLGRLTELARRVPRALETADARGDLFAANTCRLGQQNLVYLCADRPDEALRVAKDGIEPFPRDRYLTPHCHLLLASVQAQLYAGDAAAAWRTVEDDWPRLRSSQLLRAQFVRIEMRHLKARAALALASASRRSQPRRAGQLVQIARREAATIAADALDVARPFAGALEAGIHNLEGDTRGAVERLGQAASGFARSGMSLYEHAALHQRSALLGGDEGAAGRASTASWMLGESIQSPAAMAAMLVPV